MPSKDSGDSPLAAVESDRSSTTLSYAVQSYPLFKTDEVIKVGTARRLMKLDPETKMTSADAASLLSKATEIFVAGLMKACEERAKDKGRAEAANIKYKDVARVVASDPTLEFLQELLPQIEIDKDEEAGAPPKKKQKKDKSPAGHRKEAA